MSAIAGIYARTDERIDERVLDRMSAALRRLGPDGEEIETLHPVAMLYRPLHTERGSRAVAQPLWTADGSLVTWEGRLDNAGEVRALLGVTADTHPFAPHLALAAWRAWGLSGFARLLGDFSLAIWDARLKQLVLACDAIGIRSLSYQMTKDWCLWATTGRAILSATRQEGEPNDEYLADFLVNQASPRGPFKGIDLLPGGHALIVTANSARVERYWAIDPAHRIEHRSDAEYEEHFRGLFEDAISDRMRTSAPVFCELSGGLDSSAIACVAASLREVMPGTVAELGTVSYVFPQAKSADETAFVRLVEAHIGADGVHIADDEARMLSPTDPETIDADFPTNQICLVARHNRVASAMHAAGSRVLLSGLGGDQMFWSAPPEALPLADLVAERKWRALHGATRQWAYALGWPYAKTLWRGACWPLLPHQVQALFWRADPHAPSLSEWIDPRFARRMRLHERVMVIQADDLGFRLPSASAHYGVLRQTIRQHVFGLYTTEGCVEMRYPFLDRRVVEFALATPVEQKIRPGETRSIVRRALKGIMPEAVRIRRTKCSPTEAVYRALNKQWPWISRLLLDPRVCARGIASREALSKAFQEARHGRITSASQLLRVLSLELWLRSLEGRTGASAAA
jgi:asparagine synthase (glutamine-hydrolysing)